MIPEGKILSWKETIQISSRDLFRNIQWREPIEAFFYFGDAWAQVNRDGWKKYESDDFRRMRYGIRDIAITVQGTSAKDLMKLRDHIMTLINAGSKYGVRNDLNPKPRLGFRERANKSWRRWFKKPATA